MDTASFATSWLVQQNQQKNARRTAEFAKREQVYGVLIDEIFRRFGDTLEKRGRAPAT